MHPVLSCPLCCALVGTPYSPCRKPLELFLSDWLGNKLAGVHVLALTAVGIRASTTAADPDQYAIGG